MVASSKSKGKKKLAEIEAAFDRGESVLGIMKKGTAKAVSKTQKINVNFPTWMIDALDQEADKLAVDRQAIIKILLNEGLKLKGYKIAS